MISMQFEGDLTPLVEDGEAIEKRLGDQQSTLLPAIGQLGEDDIRAGFARQGSPEGDAWRALTHPYAEEKARKWGGKPILQASGALLASIGWKVEGDELLIGSIDGPPWALYTGDREFVGHSVGFEDDAEETVDTYFMEGVAS